MVRCVFLLNERMSEYACRVCAYGIPSKPSKLCFRFKSFSLLFIRKKKRYIYNQTNGFLVRHIGNEFNIQIQIRDNHFVPFFGN